MAAAGGPTDGTGAGPVDDGPARDAAGPEEPAPAGGAVRRRLAWGPVCGVVALAYVVGVALDRVLLVSDGAAFTRWHGRLDALPARALLVVVVLAAWFHALDGLRRLVAPAGRPDLRWRSVNAFLTWAVGLPLALVVLWPALGGVRG